MKNYSLLDMIPDKSPSPLFSIWLILSNSSLTFILLIVSLSVLFVVLITLLLFFLIGALQVRKPHIPIFITRYAKIGRASFLPRLRRNHKPSSLAQPRIASEMPEQFLLNKPWLHLTEECVDLFNELDELSSKLEDPRGEMATHASKRLQEILRRSGVEVITEDRVFDETRHQVVLPDRNVPLGTPITQIISPGFAIDRRVLRRAKVSVENTSSEKTHKNSLL